MYLVVDNISLVNLLDPGNLRFAATGVYKLSHILQFLLYRLA